MLFPFLKDEIGTSFTIYGEGGWSEKWELVETEADRPTDVVLARDAYGDELMQFTGLHDKNGKEIYEGDIVEFGIKNGAKLDVRYKSGGFVLHTRGMKTHPVSEHMNYRGVLVGKVIGNIYENPDLLTV